MRGAAVTLQLHFVIEGVVTHVTRVGERHGEVFYFHVVPGITSLVMREHVANITVKLSIVSFSLHELIKLIGMCQVGAWKRFSIKYFLVLLGFIASFGPMRI